MLVRIYNWLLRRKIRNAALKAKANHPDNPVAGFAEYFNTVTGSNHLKVVDLSKPEESK